MSYWLMFFGFFFISFFLRNKFGDNLIILTLTVIAGFIAPGVSQDYYNYFNGYYLSSPVLFPEPFSKLIFRITSLLDQPVTISFIIFAIISMYIKRKALIKLEVPIAIFFLVYFSKLYLLLDLTQVRAGVAIAFCLLAVYEYINNHKKWCFIYIAIGFFFHFSAIMMLAVFFVGKKKPNTIIWLTLAFLAMFLTLFDLKQMLYSILYIIHAPANYLVYLNEQSDFKVNPFSALSIINFIIFFLFSFNRSLLDDALSNVCYKLYGVSIISFYMFINFPVLSFRISEFFLIYQVVLLAKYYKNVNVGLRGFYLLILLFFSAFQLYITFNIAGIILPYEFV
ncbi:EpsG family protein [Yersinia kristensenii]|uniref:EpsG family protein n=1 Tax=Yersinia kristensenii TaxID=28152 RepID=UPI001C60E5CC|nr:EpsG family protein [Yersinia kristensenii]MBW5810716.1 EpsG family protein [Yersinia kristensenii]MBW5827853.1 EpsG family protein [Yersinia kristensenii]